MRLQQLYYKGMPMDAKLSEDRHKSNQISSNDSKQWNLDVPDPVPVRQRTEPFNKPDATMRLCIRLSNREISLTAIAWI